jgi:hypothetical protein
MRSYISDTGEGVHVDRPKVFEKWLLGSGQSTGMVVGLDQLFFSVSAQVDGQLGLLTF